LDLSVELYKAEASMLAEFWEFDRKVIHEKYTSVIEGFEIQ